MLLIANMFFCGVSEIRTRDTLLTYTRFPGVPLQPLEHHSKMDVPSNESVVGNDYGCKGR